MMYMLDRLFVFLMTSTHTQTHSYCHQEENLKLILCSPSTSDQNNLLERSRYILRKSDDSACSIIPSQASTHDNPSLDSFETTEMIHKELSIDNDLFTAGVYKRNYRNPLIHQLFENYPLPAGKMTELNRSSSLFDSDNQSQFTEQGYDYSRSPILGETDSDSKIVDSRSGNALQSHDEETGNMATVSDHLQLLDDFLVRDYTDNLQSNTESSISQFRSLEEAIQSMLIESGGRTYINSLKLLLGQDHLAIGSRSKGAMEALDVAVQIGDLELLEMLFRHEIDVNFFPGRSYPVLIEAILLQNLELIALLLQGGARVDVRERLGYYPIHFACKIGSFTCLSMLI